MTRTSIEIDADKCALLARLLGTTSDQDTVDKAVEVLLEQQGDDAERRRFIASMRAGHYAELFDEKVTGRALW